MFARILDRLELVRVRTVRMNRFCSRSTRSRMSVLGSGRTACEWLGGGAIARQLKTFNIYNVSLAPSPL